MKLPRPTEHHKQAYPPTFGGDGETNNLKNEFENGCLPKLR